MSNFGPRRPESSWLRDRVSQAPERSRHAEADGLALGGYGFRVVERTRLARRLRLDSLRCGVVADVLDPVRQSFWERRDMEFLNVTRRIRDYVLNVLWTYAGVVVGRAASRTPGRFPRPGLRLA